MHTFDRATYTIMDFTKQMHNTHMGQTNTTSDTKLAMFSKTLKGQCVSIVYMGSHAIAHDFTACEVINVIQFYNKLRRYNTIKRMEGLCEVRLKKQCRLIIE